MARTAFISYASEDESIATTISAYLERNGVSCWIAPRDVRPGADYGSEIIDGIETSAVLVLVLSEHANSSTFVKREVERAVSKESRCFPCACARSFHRSRSELFVSSAEWIDAWHPPIEQYLDRLAESIRTFITLHGEASLRPLRCRLQRAGRCLATPADDRPRAGCHRVVCSARAKHAARFCRTFVDRDSVIRTSERDADRRGPSGHGHSAGRRAERA